MTWAVRSLIPGIGGQERERASRKGGEMLVDLPVDLGDAPLQGVDLLQMQPQQEAVVFGHPAAQCLAQLAGRGA